jgi:V8-like Glu-specific endopeptidase
MNTAETAGRLHKMLSQISSNDLASLSVPRDVHESAVGAEGATADTERALDKLNQNKPLELTLPEVSNLEAIVMPYHRPVAFVRHDSASKTDLYDDLTDTWERLNSADMKLKIARLFPLIGRIELTPPSAVPFVGTGFVVADGLLMTNRHVAEVFSQGLGSHITYRPEASSVNFKRQVDTSLDSKADSLKVVGVEMIHPYWDMALLQVEGLSSHNHLDFSFTDPETLIGNDVVVIGYPARDYRNDLNNEDRIFQKTYNVKRIQPGILRKRDKVSSFKNEVFALTHDASTLGGNSGSAVIHVKSGTVIGLHFGGAYLVANYAVPTFELARDKRVAQALGLEGKVAPTTLCDTAWASTSAERPSPIVKPAPGQIEQRVEPAPADASPPFPSATFTIPLQVTLSIGTPSLQPPQAVPPVALAKRPGAVQTKTETEAVPTPDFELARAIAAYLPVLSASYLLAARAPYELPAGYTKVAEVRVAGNEAVEIESTLTPEQQLAVERDRRALSKGASAATVESLADPSAFGFVAQENATGSILVSIRGTQTPAEWLADFVPVPVPFPEAPRMGLVHVGFAVFYHKVRSTIEAALGKIGANTRITVVGHSLGGAMAVLCAADIERNMAKKNVDVCTFGGPRTGKIDFRIHFSKEISRCYRVVDALDIVPHVPSVITGWNHVGVEIDVVGKGGSSPHSLEAYLDGLQKVGGGGTEGVSAGGEVLSIRVL